MDSRVDTTFVMAAIHFDLHDNTSPVLNNAAAIPKLRRRVPLHYTYIKRVELVDSA